MDRETAADRLRIALDLYEAGELMQRQRLRRLHPDASPEDIEAEVDAWRMRRPGAPGGDCPGRLSHRFA